MISETNIIRMTVLELPLLKGKKWEIPLEQIIYIRAEGHLSLVYYKDQKNCSKYKYVNMLLGSLEKELTSSSFYRSHKSCVINLAQVLSYGTYPDVLLELKHEHYVPLSRRKRMHFHNTFIAYMSMSQTENRNDEKKKQ